MLSCFTMIVWFTLNFFSQKRNNHGPAMSFCIDTILVLMKFRFVDSRHRFRSMWRLLPMFYCIVSCRPYVFCLLSKVRMMSHFLWEPSIYLQCDYSNIFPHSEIQKMLSFRCDCLIWHTRRPSNSLIRTNLIYGLLILALLLLLACSKLLR
jgi:hypothetical protein